MPTPRMEHCEGTWRSFRSIVLELWSDLEASDLDRYEGHREQLIGHIARRTGEARSEIARRLDDAALRLRYLP